jgi:hypothetical protein
MLTNLIIFSLICYGLSNIVVFSHIFDEPREYFYNKKDKNKFFSKFYDLITCMMCFPTWVGFILSLIDIFLIKFTTFTPLNMIVGDYVLVEPYNYVLIPLVVLFDGFIASGVTWLIHTLQEFLESFKK